jgi:phosphate transport system substrate-binding protein
MRYLLITLAIAFLTGCSPDSTPAPKPVLEIYTSSSTQPWLAELYQCAEQNNVLLSISNPGASDISLRLGEPENLTSPSYKIDEEEILVVTHPQAGVSSLTLTQVQSLFSGQVVNWNEVGGSDEPIDVWVYADGEDVQQVFDQIIMDGLNVASTASLAVSPQRMSDSVGNNPGAIGILPRRWKMGNTHETFVASETPVLAMTRSEPTGVLLPLLSCLQK